MLHTCTHTRSCVTLGKLRHWAKSPFKTYQVKCQFILFLISVDVMLLSRVYGVNFKVSLLAVLLLLLLVNAKY
jgi:hypothetical protein